MNDVWKYRQRQAHSRMWRDANRRRLRLMGVPTYKVLAGEFKDRLAKNTEIFVALAVLAVSIVAVSSTLR